MSRAPKHPAAPIIGEARLAQRRRAVRRERRRRRRQVAVGLLIVTAIAAGSFALTRSPVFRLERIEVVGASRLAPADVITASGVAIGERAMAIDLDSVTAAVRTLALVRDARVERDGPLGLRIAIVERTPALEIRAGARGWYVDQDGLPIVAKGRPTLPLILMPNWMESGTDQPSLPEGAVRTTLAFWRGSPRWLQRSITSFVPAADGQVAFRMGDAFVSFGDLTEMARKQESLRLVIRRVKAEGRRLLQVNLRAPGNPAVRIA